MPYLLVRRSPEFEYTVSVDAGEVIAFDVFNGGSRQIQDSKVLPGLAIATIEEALQRSQTEEDGAINPGYCKPLVKGSKSDDPIANLAASAWRKII